MGKGCLSQKIGVRTPTMGEMAHQSTVHHIFGGTTALVMSQHSPTAIRAGVGCMHSVGTSFFVFDFRIVRRQPDG